MLRFTFLVIFLISFLILSIPVLLVEAIIGKFNRKAKDYSCLRIVQWGFRCILWITGVETTVIGEEQVPDEPVLFVGNHRSYFDILLTYSRCKRLTGYVAKKEMERFPLLNNWMRNLYCLFLAGISCPFRENTDGNSLLDIIDPGQNCLESFF